MEVKVYKEDIDSWMGIFHITYYKMYKKFYPHFVDRDDDIKQHMMVALIKAIKRIKRGEIRNERNYVITTLMGAAYRISKKLIAYDEVMVYLEDIGIGSSEGGDEFYYEWEDFMEMGCLPYERIFAIFTAEEDQWLIKNMMGVKGYSKTELKEKTDWSWGEMKARETYIKEKLVEIIKMYFPGS